MATIIKEIGKLIKSVGMDSIDLKMEVYIKAIFLMDSPTDKDKLTIISKSITIKIQSKMNSISNSIKVYGKIHSHTGKDKLSI